MLSLMGSIHVLCYLAGSASGKDGSILPAQDFLLLSHKEKFSFPAKYCSTCSWIGQRPFSTFQPPPYLLYFFSLLHSHLVLSQAMLRLVLFLLSFCFILLSFVSFSFPRTSPLLLSFCFTQNKQK